MKIFDPAERCPKCGSMVEIAKHVPVLDYIKLTCKFCKHAFKRKPLDSENKDNG